MNLTLDNGSLLATMFTEPASLLAGKIKAIDPEISDHPHLPVNGGKHQGVLTIRVIPVPELYHFISNGRNPVTILVLPGKVDIIIPRGDNEAPEVFLVSPVVILDTSLVIGLEIVRDTSPVVIKEQTVKSVVNFHPGNLETSSRG